MKNPLTYHLRKLKKCIHSVFNKKHKDEENAATIPPYSSSVVLSEKQTKNQFVFEETDYFSNEQNAENDKIIDCMSTPDVSKFTGTQKVDEQFLLRKKFLIEIVQLEEELKEMNNLSNITKEQIIDHIVFRFEEFLERYGATEIRDEDKFNCLRHRVEPSRYVEDGVPLAKITSNGWCIGNYVLKKAIVEIKENV